jgi:hypothetical protein
MAMKPKPDEKLREDATRRLLADPETQAFLAVSGVLKGLVPIKGSDDAGLHRPAAITTLEAVADATLRADDTRYLERMLLGQAQTLQAIFTQFTLQMRQADRLPQFQAFAQIALKAQHQCRQTLATLGELRHPRRATFIKQQNNAVNQQVNNGGPPAKETEKFQTATANKLLEAIPGERLELGTAATAGGSDPALETVGAVNWPEDRGRQAVGEPERLETRRV